MTVMKSAVSGKFLTFSEFVQILKKENKNSLMRLVALLFAFMATAACGS